jgi:hypothetical protein
MPPLARAAGVVLAVLACAWFALGIRQAHELDGASKIVLGLTGQQQLTAARANHADALLSSAKTLNPDQTVEVLEARVDLLRNDRAGAKRILLGVVRREPMNLDAWYGLATSARDGATVNLALSRIAQLEPKVPAPH